MREDNITKEYGKKWQQVKLSSSSRARIEQNLLEYARFHAVEEGVRVAPQDRSIKQVPQRTSLLITIFNLNTKSMTAALLAIMLIVGGSTSYAAEGAVPGDFLYPVKVEFNENIKSTFAISDEAEAKLQARLAKERLAEAQELAADGRLTAENAADLSARLKHHYEVAEEKNEAGEAEGDYQSSAAVRASIEGTFSTYAEVLSDLNSSVSGNNGVSLISDIRTYANASANSQATATAAVSADLKAAIEGTIEYAAEQIADAEAELAEEKDSLTAGAHAQIELKVQAAIEAHAAAETSFAAESYQDAYREAQTAIRLATQARTMLYSMQRMQMMIKVDAHDEEMEDVETDTDSSEEESIKSEHRDEKGENGRGRNTEDDDNDNASVEVDIETETTVDTDVIDAEVETETSVESGLRI